jgi:DNA-binding NarL/FixJ family response regulator
MSYLVFMRNSSSDKITIGLVDDHQLFVRSLSLLINSFKGYEVVVDALNGDQLLGKLPNSRSQPDILLIDVNMPGRDGISTAAVVSEKYPLTKIVALSMNDDDFSILAMIKAGCCAYLLKGIHPLELEKALDEIHKQGYYNADAYNLNYRRLHQNDGRAAAALSEKERLFLKYAASELTYKEIAARLYVSERTVDGYRESIFQKLNVQSRVGMVLEALKLKLIGLDD